MTTQNIIDCWESGVEPYVSLKTSVLLRSKTNFCPRCNMPTYKHKLSGLIDCGNDCKDRGLLSGV